METRDDILAALLRKYVANFITFLNDPSFQQAPDSRKQMVMATQILRQERACTILHDRLLLSRRKGDDSTALEVRPAWFIHQRKKIHFIQGSDDADVSVHYRVTAEFEHW
jgi:hypothetical protein